MYQCTMSVGDRKVVAMVKSVEAARKDYIKAHAAGRRAALVETVRDNLFELQLGNVQPGDMITIVLSFASPLPAEGRRRRLRVPLCPGVRFIPGKPVGADGGTDLVPDASRLLPIRLGKNHPDAVTLFCAGTILNATGVESPSHEVEIRQNIQDGILPVMLSEDSEVPDRDFVLTWICPEETIALIGKDDSEYLLCSIQTPDDFEMERGARDIFFLLDASGSMCGANWSALCEAVELALTKLSADDRLSVALFSNTMQPVTEGLVAATDSRAREVMKHLRGHRPNGGTQFTGAFARTIQDAGQARRPVVIEATDRQFGDESRACAVARDCGTEVHTIGIDANVNEAALRKIARRTRGTCSLAVPGEDLDQKYDHDGRVCCKMIKIPYEDRAVASILGGAIGDALGVTLEVFPKSESPDLIQLQVLRQRSARSYSQTGYEGGGPWVSRGLNLRPGEWTDDTAMMLCLSDNILNKGEIDIADLMARFTDWANNGYNSCQGIAVGLGGNVRNAISKFDPENPTMLCGGTDPTKDAGNGCLMRLAPVPVYWSHNLV